MPPPRQRPHKLCKSEEPQNIGPFPAPWVGRLADTRERRAYMFAYLNWMRKETCEGQLDALHEECTEKVKELFVKSFSVYGRGRFFDFVVHLWVWLIWLKDMSPVPEFPWSYSGGAPQACKKDYWKNKTTELQTGILARLGPFNSMSRNRMFVDVSSLFSIERVLGIREPVVKHEIEDEIASSQIDSELQQQHSTRTSPESSTGVLSSVWGEPSLRNTPAQDTDLSQSLSMHEPSSPISEDGEIQDISWDFPNPSTVAPDSGLSQHEEGHDQYDRQVSVPNQPPSEEPRVSPSTEPRSTLSVSFERFANMSSRLHCVEDENFDVQTIAWLLLGLGDDESRRRLFYFLDNATVDVWHCLGDVVSQPLRLLTELESSQEACVSHGISCKRVLVVEDTDFCRWLRFEAVHRDE
ncbi:hypothetical protein IL306_013426 [Fusarium sp. DS 682]|nr:hypothetical protein IL306_013426 [Fusarium sp. DS 682]